MNPRLFFIFFIGAFASLYLAYSSTVTVPYVRNDSVRYFDKYDTEDLSSRDPQFNWLCALGRPIEALEEQFVYQRINHLSDLSRLRFITIAVFALNASLLAGIVVSLGIEAIPAFCMSTAIFTLPGVQECVFVPFLFLGVAQLFSLFAYLMWISKLRYWIRAILAFILLEIAFFTYATSAFFFLIPTLFVIILKGDQWPASKKFLVRDIIFGVLAGVVYLFVIRVFFYKNVELSGHHVTWQNMLYNIKTFLPQGAPQSFNLWNIYYSKILGFSVGLFITLILIINALRQKTIAEWQRVSVIFGIFVMFNMVWIMLGGYLPHSFMASQALVLLLVYGCGDWVIKILKGKWLSQWLPVFFLLMGLILANMMTARNVWGCNAELMFIRNRLAQYADSFTQDIHIIRPKDNTQGYNGLKIVYDNFNDGSTVPDHVLSLVRVALKDMDDPPTTMHCNVTSSDYGEPIKDVGPHTLIIDMNDLVRISRDHLK